MIIITFNWYHLSYFLIAISQLLALYHLLFQLITDISFLRNIPEAKKGLFKLDVLQFTVLSALFKLTTGCHELLCGENS